MSWLIAGQIFYLLLLLLAIVAILCDRWDPAIYFLISAHMVREEMRE